MTNEEFKLSLFEAVDFFIRLAETNQKIDLDEQNRLILADFIKMITLLRDSALAEYINAEKNDDTIITNYLQKFLQRLTNLVSIAKSTDDNQKLVPAIQELISLATPSENRTIRSNASISVAGIIGGIVGFTLGFIVGVPLGLIAAAIFGGIPMIVLGSAIPMLAIGYFAGCGLLGGLVLGIAGAQKFYETCSGDTFDTTMSYTHNPLSKFEKQKTKTFNKDTFCRLFKSKKVESKDSENQHAEISTKQLVIT